MTLALVTVGFLSLPPTAAVPEPLPVLSFTEVFVRDGRVVVVGKDFQATAARFVVSPDGKRLELRGTDTEPATFTHRPGGTAPHMELSGKRITYSPEVGRFVVDGTGRIQQAQPKK